MTRRVRRPRRAARRSAPRAGFTLVELIVALFVLAVGLLAIAGFGVVALKATRRGAAQTIAASIAQARFDSLSSVPCRNLANGANTSGSATYRGVTERWVVTDGYNVKNLFDTLTVPGRAGSLAYLSKIPCRE